MKKLLLVYGIMICAFCLPIQSFAEQSIKQFQSFYSKIGNDLIKIKKEYPGSQPVVYALLDQFGKYYAMSKEVVEKKKEYKHLLKTELSLSESLKKENIACKEKIEEMGKAILLVDKKLKKDSEQVSTLLEQKDALCKEKEAFEISKQKFEFEKQSLLSERDTLISEKEALTKERDDLIKEKGESVQKKPGISRISNSAPMSPL